jgi:hypothetical protein
MTYNKFNHYHAGIWTNKQQTWDISRNNLLNLRDFLVLNGFMPGWLTYTWDSADNYLQPDNFYYWKKPELIILTATWVSKNESLNGSGNNYISKAKFEYSMDDGRTVTPLCDKQGNYVATMTYAADDTCTGISWGTTYP